MDKICHHSLKYDDVPIKAKNELVRLNNSGSDEKKTRKFGFMKQFYERL